MCGGIAGHKIIDSIGDIGCVRHILGNTGISDIFQAEGPDATLGIAAYGGWGGKAGGGEDQARENSQGVYAEWGCQSAGEKCLFQDEQFPPNPLFLLIFLTLLIDLEA